MTDQRPVDEYTGLAAEQFLRDVESVVRRPGGQGTMKFTLPNPPVALLRRNRETAKAVQVILGLPNDHWSNVRVEFELDEVATATVTMMISPEQLAALAALLAAIGGPPDG